MIAASIVVYYPDLDELETCLQCVSKCKLITAVHIIDNSTQSYVKEFLEDHFPSAEYIPSNNIGYGAANNLSLVRSIATDSGIRYHLVINSDITFTPHTIDVLVSKLEKDNKIGLIAPSVTNADGTPQSSCHPLPSPLDLLLHRFSPREMFKNWRRRYDIIPQEFTVDIDVPYIHGCFMLFTVDALKKCGLFDARFFMYPEDIDITRRIHRYFKTIVTPDVSIYHLYRGASRHSIKMLWIHAVNMSKYFKKWGWVFDKERRFFNDRLREQLRAH